MQLLPVGQSIPMPLVQQEGAGDKQESGDASFSEVLSGALKKLNDTKVNADNLTMKFFTGEIQDFHQVAIAVQEASLTMQLAVEVRNKVIEAYQEVSRMQI
ncbi:MAG: Flagellar hook-basal body complex protein FliE [Pelotomaculum sp. PtaU1.Bin035]|nr:MAG: Flagellar hook-basal body complex protein FliE [Pelotomaculum sp. PtaU1.Bin035]